MAVILFVIGLVMLLFHRNLIRKLIGMNIMDTGSFLFLASMGYIRGRRAPIITDGVTDPAEYINPVPAGLVLTIDCRIQRIAEEALAHWSRRLRLFLQSSGSLSPITSASTFSASSPAFPSSFSKSSI